MILTIKNFKIMNKTILKAISLITMLLLIPITISCNNDDDNSNSVSGCDTGNSNFKLLYNTALAVNTSYQDVIDANLLTHEYIFRVNSEKTICKIGYQGNAVLEANNLPYTIEVYNNTDAVMVYSGTHVFKSSATDYKQASGNLLPGKSYTIRRVLPASGYLGDLNNARGRICKFNLSSFSWSIPNFPFINGNIIISSDSSSNFYGGGTTPPLYYGLPYIDIVFEQ